MTEGRRYLSFGGGVNSTALMLLLLDWGIEFEAVYADHGADWPETRDYVAMLKERGYPITVLETRRAGLPLYDYYLKYQLLPIRWMRHCTSAYKVKPLKAYFQKPCVTYLGIDAGEPHRGTPSRVEDEEREYPLVDEGIDRKGCEDIIKGHGLPIPRKSGCFVCPFQRVGQWKELLTRHPDLYCKARALEEAANRRITAGGKPPIYLSNTGRPLSAVAMEDQLDLFGERTPGFCLCEL